MVLDCEEFYQVFYVSGYDQVSINNVYHSGYLKPIQDEILFADEVLIDEDQPW